MKGAYSRGMIFGGQILVLKKFSKRREKNLTSLWDLTSLWVSLLCEISPTDVTPRAREGEVESYLTVRGGWVESYLPPGGGCPPQRGGKIFDPQGWRNLRRPGRYEFVTEPHLQMQGGRLTGQIRPGRPVFGGVVWCSKEKRSKCGITRSFVFCLVVSL